jgi:hypothetical protein
VFINPRQTTKTLGICQKSKINTNNQNLIYTVLYQRNLELDSKFSDLKILISGILDFPPKNHQHINRPDENKSGKLGLKTDG